MIFQAAWKNKDEEIQFYLRLAKTMFQVRIGPNVHHHFYLKKERMRWIKIKAMNQDVGDKLFLYCHDGWIATLWILKLTN